MLANRDFHLQTGNLGYKTGLSFTNRDSWVTNGILGLLFTLMIYVRVKYPNNIFGKVLMWIYIALIVIGIIVLSVVIISCGIAFGACVNGMMECGEIGAKFIGILWR